jgi:hypothetical protein
MTTEMKNKVNPDYLEDWLIKNPSEVYRRSVETALSLLGTDKKEAAFLEFYWEGEVYSKIYMKKSDIPTAMDKAIEYFVSCELYEEAVVAKKAKDSFIDLENL